MWSAYGLTPSRIDTFKLSNDPLFVEKLFDVVGVYLDPPERAAVFAFDEKTQVQALDRTQPSLPLTRGRAETMTHDYKRNGTLDLFAAMNLATGQVTTDVRERHTAADVLAFFKKIDHDVPRGLQIHVVLDNVSAHEASEVRDWLARPRQDRWHLHFTPTSSSWLNLIGGWFRQLRTAPTPPQLHQPRTPRRRHRPLDRHVEHRPHTIHLDRPRRRHPHQNRTRPHHPPH